MERHARSGFLSTRARLRKASVGSSSTLPKLPASLCTSTPNHFSSQAQQHPRKESQALLTLSSSSSSSKSSKSSTGDPYALPRAAVAVAVAAHLLRRHSVEPPFLVADNRHFPFYVWRKVLHHPGRPWLKWALAPLYVAVAYLVAARLLGRGSARSSNSSRSSSASSVGRISSGSGSGSSGSSSRNDGGSGVSRLWLLIWFVASALVLVPSPLLEPRYFTTAVMVAHAHAPPRPSWKATAATGALFAACNAAVLGLFLLRPFQWPDGSTARFMW